MQMKELLTKRFWQSVKKTYEDARNGPSAEEKAVEASDKDKLISSDAPEKEEH